MASNEGQTLVGVPPHQAADHGVVHLSPLDQLSARFYVRVVWFFPIPEGSSHNTMIEAFQYGLDQAIAQIPWLSGDVVPAEGHGKQAGCVMVRPGKNTKIEVIDLTGPESTFPWTYEDLKAKHFPVAVMDDAIFAPCPLLPTPGRPAPVMACRAIMIHGGLLVGVCGHHSVVDGGGASIIMVLLAHHCEQLDKSDSASSVPFPLSPKALDRSVVTARNASGSSKAAVESKATTVAEMKSIEAFKAAAVSTTSLPPLGATENAVFHISAEKLVALKAAAAPTHCSEPQAETAFASTNDALTALLWHAIVSARDLKGSGIDEAVFRMAMDGRSRLAPIIPPDYLGNATVVCTSTMPLAKLIGNELSTLADAAQVIRQAISKVDLASIMHTVAFVEDLPDVGALARGRLEMSRAGMIISSWSTRPVYSLNFGERIGRCERVRYIKGDILDGRAVVVANPPGGGLEFVLGLDKESMARLVQNELFSRYCTRRC